MPCSEKLPTCLYNNDKCELINNCIIVSYSVSKILFTSRPCMYVFHMNVLETWKAIYVAPIGDTSS